MAVRVESHAEPLPGYRLIERLGGGGFGEVWKCEAPGGLHKAIKFVFGDLQGADENGARAEQELKALSRVKTVHHPYILSLERYDIIDGQLIIVMELADRTIWDRFKECREQGLQGIPREELLGYMAETAEALDLMNSLYQLQHLDIKPQNLFLVHNHVKVADFGLVKDLEGMVASVTGGVTPVYAAPETFDGYVSRYSDQYSLAIVYQELLTGHRPFTGTTIRQLVLQHLQGTPDLSSLPAADRVVVARALAKKHDDRFPTCETLIQALREAGQPAPAPAAPVPQLPREATRPAKLDTPAGASGDGDKTQGSLPPRNPAAKVREPGRETPPPLDPDAPTAVPAASLPTPVPAGPTRASASGGSAPADGTPGPEPETDRSLVKSVRHLPTEIKGDGVLRPTLVIGLGHHGLGILKRLRRELFEHFGVQNPVPHVRLLYIDTDPEALATALAGPACGALRSAEVLQTRLHRPSHYLKPGDGQQRFVSWLNPKVLYRMPRQPVSNGMRALGRLAFVDNYRGIFRRIELELEACRDEEAMALAAERTGLAVRSKVPRVYVATSLGGGTGSGMFLDMAYTVRHLLRQQGFERAEVVGLFLLPGAERGTARAPAPGLANAVAALTELNHFACPDTLFQARYETTDQRPASMITEAGPPFQRCVLLPLPERRGPDEWLKPAANGNGSPEPPAAGPIGLAGHFLLTELVTPLARATEQARAQAGTPVYQTLGMYRLLWPRRQLLQQAARHLCRRLVQRWMSKDAKALREGVQQWVEAQWTEQGLSADQLILRLQEDCARTLGNAPENMFATILAGLAPGGKPGPDFALKPAAVVEVLEQLDQLVGIPEECRPRGPTLPDAPVSRVEEAVRQAVARAKEDAEQHLAELLVRLIEEPAFRLAGAEEANRQFSTTLEKALQHQEHLGRELRARAAALYQRLHALLENPGQPPPTNSLWKTPFNRKAASEQAALVEELFGVLRSYPKCRYQSLILHHLTGLYVSLRGLLSEQMNEISFCRQRLAELSELFDDKGAPVDLVPAAGRCIFPSKCDSLREAVKQLETGVSATDLQTLDQRVQALLRKHFRALVHVCTATSNIIRNVAPAMQQEAEAFLGDRLGAVSVTDMYLALQGARAEGGAGHAAFDKELVRTFDLADPELVVESGRDVCVLAVPPGPGEQEFRERAKAALPDVPLAAAAASDEILVYREQVGFCLADLPQMGSAGREAYEQLACRAHLTPHSRMDITEWRAAVGAGR